MKRIFLGILISLILIAGVGIGDGWAQGIGTPPPLNVSLVLNSSRYILNDPLDPIKIELTIKNFGATSIFTSADFTQEPFHLLLIFTDPAGKPITAPALSNTTSEEEPPRVIFVDGVLPLQVDQIEVLPVGFTKIITIPDARKYYSLIKAGKYSVKAVIPIRTYPAITHTVSGVSFSTIDSFNFAGTIQSNTAKFSIITDSDVDTYSFPEPDIRISPSSLPDCNDLDALVNPGKIEIPNNGKDDDCNPATLDNVIGVTIDIKPGSFPNSINLGSAGTVPVAILSTTAFDATKVDPTTVTLASAPVQLKGKGTPMASFQDVNMDGSLDLVVHVSTSTLQLSATDTEAILEGRTFFVTGRPVFYIQGSDSIRVVP